MGEKEDTKDGDSEKIWDERLEKEWENARDVLSSFDERLHDLRKWGFTAFTTLIGASALLLNTAPMVSGADPGVKFAAVAATILLIVAMRVIDKSYELFQRAASTRALIIERHLDLELTEIIEDKYKRGHILGLINLAYLGFVVAVGLLGQFILNPEHRQDLNGYLWIVSALAVVTVALVSQAELRYPNGLADWTIGPLEIRQGEKVRITVTNLAPAGKGAYETEDKVDRRRKYEDWLSREKDRWREPGITFYAGMLSHWLSMKYSNFSEATWSQVFGSRRESIQFNSVKPVCEIQRENEDLANTFTAKDDFSITTEHDLSIPGQSSHTWLWPKRGGSEPDPGVYLFTPQGRGALRRKVIVKQKLPKKETPSERGPSSNHTK